VQIAAELEGAGGVQHPLSVDQQSGERCDWNCRTRIGDGCGASSRGAHRRGGTLGIKSIFFSPTDKRRECNGSPSVHGHADQNVLLRPVRLAWSFLGDTAGLFLDIAAWRSRLHATAGRFLPRGTARVDRDTVESGLNVLAAASPRRFLTIRAINFSAHGDVCEFIR
jgi:hypothetical protein